MKLLFLLFSGIFIAYSPSNSAFEAHQPENLNWNAPYQMLSDTVYITDTICSGKSYFVGNFTYSTTGTFQSLLIASDGSDSIVILNLTVLPPIQNNITDTICSGISYYVGNFTYSTTGLYQGVLVAPDGCDSIVNLNLTVLPPIQNNLTENICTGQSYYVGNFTYSTTGLYQAILVTPEGCDSIVNLDLTVLPTFQQSLTATICSGQSFQVGDTAYTNSGVYQTTLTASNGCDSIVDLNLTVSPPLQQAVSATICSGQTFQVGDSVYTNSGVYQSTLTASNGCDSIVTLNLTVLPPIQQAVAATICSGQSYTLGSSVFTQSGQYQEFLTTPGGCDSIVNLNLTVLPPIQQAVAATICSGQSYTLGASVFTQSGQYQEFLTTPDGCDSIVTLNLTVLPPIQQAMAATICNGQTYTLGTSVFTQSGQYQEVFTAANGCDSTVTLNLIVLPPIQQAVSATICNGQTYTLGTSVFTQSGQYQEVYTAANGCDSTVTLNLTVLPPIQQAVATTICNGESYTLGTSVFTQSGQYQEVFAAANGCDSIVTLNLTVLPPIQQVVSATICNGESYTLGTSVFTQSGQYQEVLTATNGCDSMVDLSLNVLPPFVVLTQVEPLACAGQTGEISVVVEGGNEPYQYSLDNGPFQSEDLFSGLQPGVYVIVVQDGMGCTSSIAATVEPAPALTLSFPETQLSLESGDSILLTPIANFTVDSFVWQPEEGLDCPQCWQPEARPARNITYQLTAYSPDGCEATASVRIKVVIIRRIYIPNVFNPDDDGLNDTFTLYSDEQVVKILRMSVFDRWGEEIFNAGDFSPNELTTGWDGRFRGKEMSPGVYVYVFEVLFTDGTTGQYSGDVTLLR